MKSNIPTKPLSNKEIFRKYAKVFNDKINYGRDYYDWDNSEITDDKYIQFGILPQGGTRWCLTYQEGVSEKEKSILVNTLDECFELAVSLLREWKVIDEE